MTLAPPAPAALRGHRPAPPRIFPRFHDADAPRARVIITPAACRDVCPCGGGCPRCRPADSGRPLDDSVRAEMNLRFGQNFSAVRVHTDQNAAAAVRRLGANAFTFGTDIFFADGRYKPESPAGRRLIRHELAHVVQQSRAPVGIGGDPRPSNSVRHEAEARAAADGTPVQFSPHASSIQCDGSGTAPTTGPDPLDPVLAAQMRRLVAQWLASQTGTPSLTSPVGFRPRAGGSLGPQLSLRLPANLQLRPAMSPSLFSPLPPDPTFVPPDYTSLYGPYNTRSVAVPGRERDAPVIDRLYRQRWALVRDLPDLRSWAPPFLRPLIPNTWRRDLASALTGLTVDAGLKKDFPTPIETADRFFMQITGDKNAVPTYINPPFKPFKWEF